MLETALCESERTGAVLVYILPRGDASEFEDRLGRGYEVFYLYYFCFCFVFFFAKEKR